MKKKNIKLRALIMLALAFIAGYCSFQALGVLSGYRKADKIYGAARAEVFTEKMPAGQEAPGPIFEVNFQKLRELSPEAIGWLCIPGTEISFPLVQGPDNEKYLHAAYDGQPSASGSIFLDFRNSPSFADKNSVIYGHNMKNGSMFGGLSKFADQRYANSHRAIYVITGEGALKYWVFSHYIANTLDGGPYKVSFEPGSFAGQLRQFASNSTITPGWQPEEGSRVITLSTCVNDYSERRILHAALVENYTRWR